MSAKVPCLDCRKPILPATAERTGGVCRPCWRTAERCLSMAIAAAAERPVGEQAAAFASLARRVAEGGFRGEIEGKIREQLSPMVAAARAGSAELVEALLEAGMPAAPLPPPRDRSPLAEAAEGGHSALVELFLARGASPDERLDDQQEAGGLYPRSLELAARARSSESVLALLCAGADPWLRLPWDGAGIEEIRGLVLEARRQRSPLEVGERPVGVTCTPAPAGAPQEPCWDLFDQTVDIGNAEHSVVLVEAPIEKVSRALAQIFDAVQIASAIEEEAAVMPSGGWLSFVLQLESTPWTAYVHGVGSLARTFFQEGKALSAQLSASLGRRVIYASWDDTSCLDFFELFDMGDEKERLSAKTLDEEGVALPGVNPYHAAGLEMIGVDLSQIERVDALQWGL